MKLIKKLNKKIDNTCIYKHIAKAFLNSATSVTTGSDQRATVPLNDSVVVGTKLSFNSTDKCIVIGGGVSKVLIRGFLGYKENGETAFRGVGIQKSNDISVHEVLEAQTGKNDAYRFIIVEDVIMDVAQGDKIFLKVRTVAQTSKSVSITGSSTGDSTHLYVEVLE